MLRQPLTVVGRMELVGVRGAQSVIAPEILPCAFVLL